MITSNTRNTSVNGVTLISSKFDPASPIDIVHYPFRVEGPKGLASLGLVVGFFCRYEAQEEELQQREVIVESLHCVGVSVVEHNCTDSDNQTVTCCDQR